MYSVIIVDDEMLIRKRIRLGFDWNAFGYEVLDDVENGYDAIKLIEEKHHDLAIIDIAMPEINGIELTRILRERHIDIKIIFLTGHSDFAYAQQAIQYSVFDYILKPIHEEKFESALKELSHIMDTERENSAFINLLTKKQKTADAVLQSRFFSNLFHLGDSSVNNEDIAKLLDDNWFSEDGVFYTIVFRESKYWDNPDKISDYINEVMNICQKFDDSANKLFIIFDMYDSSMNVIRKVKESIDEKAVWNFAESVRSELSKSNQVDFYCGISQVFLSLENLIPSYKQAISALNNTKVTTKKALSYSDVKSRENSNYKITSEIIKRLQLYMGQCEYQRCRDTIVNIFNEMIDKGINYENIIFNCNRLLLGISDVAGLSGLEIRKYLNGYSSLETAFYKKVNTQEMIEWFCEVINTLIESKISNTSKNSSSVIVDKAAAYIHDNYTDPSLNQTKIAEALSVTTSYISGLYKRVMGMTMVQYITMVRLEKAKEILTNNNVDLRHVSESIGFSDEYYFSRCFKKYFGVSPSHVKKMNKQH